MRCTVRLAQVFVMVAACTLSVHAQSSGGTRSAPNHALSPATQQPTNAKRAGKSGKSSEKKKRPPFSWVNPLPKSHAPGLKHATFSSSSLGREVGYLVLFPEGYDRTELRYPVVYYLHGGRPGSESKSYRLADPIQKLMKLISILSYLKQEKLLKTQYFLLNYLRRNIFIFQV